jgi:hypothetical protein
LQQQAHSFVNTNNRSLLIPSIQRSLRQGRETIEFEGQLNARLLDFLDDPELSNLPLNVLAWLITFSELIPTENTRDEFDRLFTFCIRMLDDQGSNASVCDHQSQRIQNVSVSLAQLEVESSVISFPVKVRPLPADMVGIQPDLGLSKWIFVLFMTMVGWA